jgi:hypothetical protein
MKPTDDKHIEATLQNFVRELTTISIKHGVAVMSMGGVFILEDAKAMQDISYIYNANNGDLEFKL